MQSFTRRVKELIRQIPAGRVCTYGMIAASAGNARAARQVGRILHACSRKDHLPWHRVVNRHGRISLPNQAGSALQRRLLEAEGIVFGPEGAIDLDECLWLP